jgi:hypothetical protein
MQITMNGMLAQNKGFIRVLANWIVCEAWDLSGSVGERRADGGISRPGRQISGGACFPRDLLGDQLNVRPDRAGVSAAALCFFLLAGGLPIRGER